MKKILFLISFLVLCKISYCDVVPDFSHSVKKCVKIINATDFSDISIVAHVKHPTGADFETYFINPKTCLQKGYKFNSLYIFAVKKSYLIGKKLDSIDWSKDNKVLKSNISIDCYGGYESNANPVSSIEEFYKIDGFTDTSVILYKCKEIIRFSDGRPISVKTYSYVEGREKLDKINLIKENSKNDQSAIEILPNTEVLNFLKALLLTILIETIVLFILFKTIYKTLNIKSYLLLFTGVSASFLTLPYVWFVLPIFIKPTLPYMFISELSVMIIESLIIYGFLRINYKKALVVSVICNLTSFIIGLIIN